MDGADAVAGRGLADLARGASHALLNLQGALLMRTQLLRHLEFDRDRFGDAVDQLEELVRDCMESVAPLQQLGGAASRPGGPQPVVDVAAHLDSSRAALVDLLPEQTELTIEQPTEPVLAPLTPQVLELILQHLVTNAAEALTSDGGTVNLRLCLRGAGDDRRASLEVADDGPGMPPEVLGDATRPYVTTKRARPGAGLGLTIVEVAVVTAGGSLTIHNPPIGGCTVRLTFGTISADTTTTT